MQVEAQVNFLENDKFQAKGSLSQVPVYIDKNKETESACGSNPLELFLSALGGCVGVYAKRYLSRHNIAFSKLDISVVAELAQNPPMRLANIKVNVDTDANLEDKKDVFLRFIKNCPVHNTLLNTKEVDIKLAS